MKQFITLIALMLVFATATFAQAEKTLIKSIPAENMMAAMVELPGEVNVSNWDKNFVRVTAVVRVTNTTESILKRLVMVGRYEIDVQEDKNTLVLTMPKTEHTVIIKGVNLEEVLSFEVQLPVGMKAVIKDTKASAQPAM
jgi:hypothetical protein